MRLDRLSVNTFLRCKSWQVELCGMTGAVIGLKLAKYWPKICNDC